MKGNTLNVTTLENYIFFEEDHHDRQHVYMQSVLALDKKNSFTITTKHSKHSRKRASQRSLDYRVLLNVLLFGSPFYRQGMTFYTVMEKDLPKGLDQRMIEKVRNLIVVTVGNDHEIITCYYAKNAVKHLKRKGKELKK